MEEKQDYGVEEEMTLDDVDSVRGLLDRLKYEKEKELKHVSSAGTSSLQDNEISTSHSSKNDLVGELQKKQKSRVTKTKSSPGNIRSQTETVDTSKKRKQNEFSVEVQERAEVISKSARKGPGTLVSSLAENTEGDSDTEEFLKKIRAAPSAPTQGQSEFVHTRVHRSKSASEVDLSVVVSNSSQLNLEAQKSKITVARSGSMKGRRKPTVSMRRRSLKSGFMDDWDDEEDISEGDESMDEDTGMGLSGESFIFKEPPKMPAGNDGIKQRSKPKHKKKSHTVSGIVLPGLAETLKTRNSSTRDVAQPQVSAAEVVRVAAEGKRNQAAKEERVEKEAEKPAWLVEAEARRKLHEQRRHNKTKQHEEREQDQSKPHNVVLRPVRKAEHGRTKTNEDNDVSREALNIRLRPVPKQESITLQAQEGNENDNKKSHNVVLRPIPKRESAVIDREDSNEKFYNVRLRPVGSSGISGTTSSSSQHSSRSLTPISLDNPTRRRSESKVSEVSSSHSTRLNGGGSRVTVSSDYVNAPHKLTTKSKTSLNNKSKTVTVTASEVPDPSATARRKSVEFVHTKVEWKGSSSAAALGHAVSRNSHSDLKEASHDRAVTYDPTYRPSHTGEVLPQWKIDLMEKKKYVAAFPVRPPPATQISNTATVPQWKKQLAEKRKQRVDLNDVQETNKENESKTSPETPLWKKEVAERRKRREASPVRKHPEIIEKRPEIPEWKKKLSVSRRPKSTTIAENPAEESVDQVPGFMKEFEKKKKNRTRGGNKASYV